MIWKALMNDGTEVYESLNGVESTLKDLDKDNVEKFSIIDSNKSLINLDLANGNFSLNNLDLTKLNELENEPSLELKYDSSSQGFKLTPNSLEILNNLILQNDRANQISFDQTGVFLLNGLDFYMGFCPLNSKLLEFKNQPPYKDIVQVNDAITDYTGYRDNANPYKRFDAVIAHTIGYNKIYNFSMLTFKLSLLIKYDVVQKCALVNCTITTNETVKGDLFVFFNGNQSSLGVTLYKDEPANLTRVITLM